MQALSVYHQHNLLYTQEALSRYKPGGYHPVALGDTFKNGRYTVHHKLGWGGFSTVWLAHDGKTNQWVSLKIITADNPQHPQIRELDNFHLLESRADAEEGLAANYIVQLLDEFTHEGPNGIHRCLVFELLGPSLDKIIGEYHDGGDCLEPETILRISRQILEGIKFVHDAGMGHGDISGANIAFGCSGLTNATRDEVLRVLGQPEAEDLIRLDGQPLAEGLPRQIVKATDWEEWIEEDEEDIRLLDLGEAFLQSDRPITKLAQPGNLRVPETVFVERFDYRVDLYRAGCVIHALVFGSYPFYYLGDDDVLVAQMIGFVETLPEQWRPKWEQMKLNSRYQDTKEDQPLELQTKFDARVGDASLVCLIPIMMGLMRFLPAERMEAAEALDLLEASQEGDQINE
ncbi:hypothetical protein BDV06DRAFT_219633 [Aspergillus oleicola]